MRDGQAQREWHLFSVCCGMRLVLVAVGAWFRALEYQGNTVLRPRSLPGLEGRELATLC